MSSQEYTRRDYAEDDPDSVQSGGVTKAVDLKAVGKEHRFSDLYDTSEKSPGHDSDEAAVAAFCDGSRDTREPRDSADEWEAKFSGYL